MFEHRAALSWTSLHETFLSNIYSIISNQGSIAPQMAILLKKHIRTVRDMTNIVLLHESVFKISLNTNVPSDNWHKNNLWSFSRIEIISPSYNISPLGTKRTINNISHEELHHSSRNRIALMRGEYDASLAMETSLYFLSLCHLRQ